MHNGGAECFEYTGGMKEKQQLAAYKIKLKSSIYLFFKGGGGIVLFVSILRFD